MKVQWRKGPPPSIGWWPASYMENHGAIRWWNGKVWSWPAAKWASAKVAATIAKMPAEDQKAIQWTDRWWL